MLFKKRKKLYRYEIYDADGHVIAGGFSCRHLEDIEQTFEDMKPTAKRCLISDENNFKTSKKLYRYEIYDADGNVIAGGFTLRHLEDIEQTFENMKPTAKRCLILDENNLFDIKERM